MGVRSRFTGGMDTPGQFLCTRAIAGAVRASADARGSRSVQEALAVLNLTQPSSATQLFRRSALDRLSPSTRGVGAITHDDANAGLIGALLAEYMPFGVHIGEIQALVRFITLVGTVPGDRVVVRTVAAPTDCSARSTLLGHLRIVHSPGRARSRAAFVPPRAVNLLHRQQAADTFAWPVVTAPIRHLHAAFLVLHTEAGKHSGSAARRPHGVGGGVAMM